MRIAIVGAGLAGLVTAREIHKANPDATVDVFEATDRIGGKLFTASFASGPTDVGAEAFLARREDAMAYVKELGLEVVHPSGAPATVYTGGQLKRLPRGGVMGIPSRGEMVADLVSPETVARIDAEHNAPGLSWSPDEDVSVGQLVRERYGDEVVDRILSALLGGVYSCSADELGLRATVPTLAAALDELAEQGSELSLSAAVRRVEEQRRASSGASSSTASSPVFAGLRGGYAELYEALAEQSGASIYLDAFISGIETEGSRYRLVGGGEPAQELYDKLVLATPAPTTALLLKKLAPNASALLKTIKLANSVVVAMKFDSAEGLPDYSGVLVASDEPDMHAKAFTFSSNKWPHLQERGGALVRASFGRFGDNIALSTDEDTLVDWALDDLQTITGFDGRAAGLAEIFTQRWFGGLPRYDAQHLRTVDGVSMELEKIQGLELTGAWNAGVGVPDVIADARRAARRVLA